MPRECESPIAALPHCRCYFVWRSLIESWLWLRPKLWILLLAWIRFEHLLPLYIPCHQNPVNQSTELIHFHDCDDTEMESNTRSLIYWSFSELYNVSVMLREKDITLEKTGDNNVGGKCIILAWDKI